MNKNTNSNNKRIVIIGGGISGLAAAHKLTELYGDEDTRPEIILIEESSRLGGVIKTETENGCLMEQGPDAFITQKPWAIDLCERAGLLDNLVNTNSEMRRTLVVKDSHLYPIPEGFMMLAPTRIWPLVCSPLFSPLGKARMAMDMFISPAKENEDESLAEFVTRRLGKEALERIAQPMVGGIYGADPNYLSLKATMPRFQDLEQKHGSIIKALSQRSDASESGARYSMFVTLKEGLEGFVKQLADRLPANCIKLNTKIDKIDRSIKTNTYIVSTESNESIEADAVIIATPAHVTANLVQEIDKQLAGWLSAIRHSSTAVLNLIFDRKSIGHKMDGFGFVVPEVEKLNLMACTFSSVKFPHRAPSDLVSMRAFIGGMLNEEILSLDDNEIVEKVLTDLNKLMQISGSPIYSKLARHPRTMPQYDVGHTSLIEKMQYKLDTIPGLCLAGNSYKGIGIPDCINSGESAANETYKYLNSHINQETRTIEQQKHALSNCNSKP